MPNAIKYNTNPETLALRKGDFYIGTGDVGKGPTSSTGYYNGITPPPGGYTIYVNKASGGPSIKVASNEAELIAMTNEVGGTSFTTTGECLNYFVTQTDKMCLNRDYEPIITNNLKLNIDFGFTPSYPKSGYTAYGLTIDSNNVTFNSNSSSSIEYTNNNGGGFKFLGNNFGPLGLPQVLSDFTVEFAVNLTGFTSSSQIIGYSGQWLSIVNATTWSFRYTTGASWSSSFGDLSTNTPYCFSFVRSGSNIYVYINGNLQATSLNIDGDDVLFRDVNGINYIKGTLHYLRIYNNALTSEQVLSNFNAQKSRFGY